MFWFELPLKVGKAVLAASSPSLLPRPVMRTGRSSEKAAGAWRPGTGEMSYIPMLVSPVPPPSTNGTLSTIGSPPPSLGSRKPSTASDGSSRAPSAHTSRGLPLPAVSESGNTPTATAASVFASSVLTASPRRQPAIALPPPAAARSTSDQSVGLDDGMPSDPPVSILVVDDDPLTRRLMSRMLERMGHRVSSAENGAVALEMLLASPKDGEPRADEAGWEGPFDVCVCDNWMPVLSGCEVVEELRRRGRADFFVGATGNALIKDQKDYKEAGADECVVFSALACQATDPRGQGVDQASVGEGPPAGRQGRLPTAARPATYLTPFAVCVYMTVAREYSGDNVGFGDCAVHCPKRRRARSTGPADFRRVCRRRRRRDAVAGTVWLSCAARSEPMRISTSMAVYRCKRDAHACSIPAPPPPVVMTFPAPSTTSLGAS